MFGSTRVIYRSTSSLILTLLLLSAATPAVRAQAYERDLNTTAQSLLTIKNRTGRVSVIASDNEKDKASLKASSAGGTVEASDITVSGNDITVRERPYRIDLTIRVPKRARVKIETEAGMVDVIGDFEAAEVITNTGTIHADVPTEALKLKFQWASSRPRYLSDVELPRVKEGRAGAFSITGMLGAEAKQKKQKKPKVSDDANPDKGTSDGNGDKAAETADNGSDS